MTPNELAKYLFFTYEEFTLTHLRPSNCKHGEVVPALQELVSRGTDVLKLEELGRSLEGRTINMISCGHGEKRVLLWSQMHGDESTATLALLDIFNFLIQTASNEPWVGKMLEQTSLHVIPMLNPDGAERVQRHTAVHIDMNRDARTLATPEAQILRNSQRMLKPGFGFNLHDQQLSSVGNSREVAAIALLAPALDQKKTTPLVRVRAMRVAALIARALSQFIEGHIATYEDSHEPRAFGDSMQSWGTSTVLIESGHWPKDPDKSFIRKLNYVAILAALRAIGDGSYQDVELDYYSKLKPNGKSIYDIIIRDIVIEHPGGWSHRVDLGLMVEAAYNRPVPPGGSTSPGPDGVVDRRPTLSGPDHRRDGTSTSVNVTIKEIGDLGDHEGLESISGHERRIPSTMIAVDAVLPLRDILDALQIYFPNYGSA